MADGQPHHAALPAGYKLHWYEIESILGQGGFGITYLAADTNLEHKVAIKEFLPTHLAVRTHDSSVQPMSAKQLDTFGWGLSRFISEAKTLAKFEHPNIVRVAAVFEENNTAYMVMAYVEGQTLEDALKFRRVQTEQQLLDFLHPLLDGLEQIHEAGFIHRDIKPDNIYIRENGSPVLLDFGSARQAVGSQTRTLTALVTSGYAPFEQYGATKGSDKQGPWTDIYALGATLYRAVTGRPPIDAMQRVNAVVGEGKDIVIPAASMGEGQYSKQFLEAIDSAIEFLPEKRPRSIAEWREMLPGSAEVAPEDQSEAKTVAAATQPPPSPEAPSREKPKSRRALWITLAAMVVAGVGLTYLWPTFQPQEPDVTVSEARLPPSDGSEEANAERLAQEQAALEAENAAAAEHAEVQRKLEEDQARLAEVERKLKEEQARLAEVERVRKETEEGQAAEEKRKAEELRLAQEAEQLAEIERQVAEEKRKAEELRLAQEAAQLAEIERLAAEAELRRLAEEQRKVEEEAEQRAQEQPARELAEHTRALEEKTDALLIVARAHLDALRLTSPTGNNAFEVFTEILSLDPDNEQARLGLMDIVGKYIELAEKASAKGRLDRAEEYFEKAERVVPNSEIIVAARQSLTDAETEKKLESEQLAERLAAAQSKLESDTQGWMGLYFGDKEPRGARVTKVYDGTSASRAGLKLGDVVIGIDSRDIDNAAELRTIMHQARSGDQVSLVVEDASGERRVVQLSLDAMPAHEQELLPFLVAYGAADYIRAARLLEPLARNGHAVAQGNLGNLYLDGKGVAQDDHLAIKWFRLSAEQGNAFAQGAMGYMYLHGRGTPKSEKEAALWYGLAAKQGNAYARGNLAWMYQNGSGVNQDDREALRLYRLSAGKGEAFAQGNLAWMYANGIAVRKDEPQAVRLYRLAAEQGEAYAQGNLAWMYQNGAGVGRDEREAARWYRLAADQGEAFAQYNLGWMNANGVGVSRDDREAVRLYRLAAAQEYALAQFNLGWMYANGFGVNKDDRESVRWYRLAAAQGEVYAQYNLGWSYANGVGVGKDEREAVRLYRLAADQGYELAQYNLGWSYVNGVGVAKDEREAVRLYRMAADQGYELAQYNLGWMYANGVGVSRNEREAVRLYRLAAEQGYELAQYNLGWAYENGVGVNKNKNEAVRWYRLAAQQNVDDARQALVRLGVSP